MDAQDRDDNPFKLSPRFKNKTIVVKREVRHCGDFIEEYGSCLAANDFDASKCTSEMKATERCIKELKQPRRQSPFNYHLRKVISNKYRIPLK